VLAIQISDECYSSFAFALLSLEAQDSSPEGRSKAAWFARGSPRTFLLREDSNMKKPALVSIIAFLAFVPISAQGGQNADSAPHQNSNPQKKSKKPASISGKIGSDCKTFTADKDSKIWKVSNPEILTGIEGRHVKVRAHVDAAQSQIQVVSVHAIAEQLTGIRLHDSAFRR
jgi:hypothetical protein